MSTSSAERLKEILARTRRLQLNIQRLMNSQFRGEYRSAFKGTGLEFDEVRAYQYGDDVRAVDWNVSARMNQLYVKLFREERELSLFVMIDTSGSSEFGAQSQTKWQVSLEFFALLAFSTLRNNDRFGGLAFSDRTEAFFPLSKGRNHVMRSLSQLVELQPLSRQTRLSQAFETVRRSLKRRTLLFVLSDFLDLSYEESLRAVAYRHDVVLVRLFHPAESLHEFEGLIPIQGLEHRHLDWLCRSAGSQASLAEERFHRIDSQLAQMATQFQTGYLNLDITREWLPLVEKFFTSHKHAQLSNLGDRLLVR